MEKIRGNPRDLPHFVEKTTQKCFDIQFVYQISCLFCFWFNPGSEFRKKGNKVSPGIVLNILYSSYP